MLHVKVVTLKQVKEIEIPASKVPAFKAGKALKDAVKYLLLKSPIKFFFIHKSL